MRYLPWFCLWVALGASCQSIDVWVHGPQPWDGKLWLGDSRTGTIIRKQDGFGIGCSDKQFDTYVCMSEVDFASLAENYEALKKDCREPDYD